VASAIETTVLRAHPAGLLQSLAELLASAMVPDAEIVGVQVQRRCDVVGSFAFEVQPLDEIRILRLERGYQRFHARTNSAFFC
jgi:hypothetical protein